LIGFGFEYGKCKNRFAAKTEKSIDNKILQNPCPDWVLGRIDLSASRQFRLFSVNSLHFKLK